MTALATRLLHRVAVGMGLEVQKIFSVILEMCLAKIFLVASLAAIAVAAVEVAEDKPVSGAAISG